MGDCVDEVAYTMGLGGGIVEWDTATSVMRGWVGGYREAIGLGEGSQGQCTAAIIIVDERGIRQRGRWDPEQQRGREGCGVVGL